MTNPKKVPCVILGDLAGPDGNVYAILTKCHLAALEAGWTRFEWKEWLTSATTGTYEDVLQKIRDDFDVMEPEDETR